MTIHAPGPEADQHVGVMRCLSKILQPSVIEGLLSVTRAVSITATKDRCSETSLPDAYFCPLFLSNKDYRCPTFVSGEPSGGTVESHPCAGIGTLKWGLWLRTDGSLHGQTNQ